MGLDRGGVAEAWILEGIVSFFLETSRDVTLSVSMISLQFSVRASIVLKVVIFLVHSRRARNIIHHASCSEAPS